MGGRFVDRGDMRKGRWVERGDVRWRWVHRGDVGRWIEYEEGEMGG